ncbi:stress protein [Adhaeribacter arboris]|uniref:Stress protein n=1 Tax=Adhaeribacter arboris TaxID=2072846 RepID=A0A2T2YMW6_9BACT|nr:Dabb family protein [Adhaeribacter arboris]PSR56853.1 stress protein [Adhaeribacter arboris]
MKITIFLIFINLLLLAACSPKIVTTAKQQYRPLNLPAEAQIQRIVCFKFKAGTTPAEIQQHMRGFANLKDSISYLLSYQAGPTVYGDLTEKPEYDVMHYCTYRNEEEIKLYSVHPVHLRFIKQNKAIWEKVLVINSRMKP